MKDKILIDVIVGARPNFMKVSALFSVAERFDFLDLRLIHTGQHYDNEMSDVFFREFDLPKPEYNLGVGSASHALQTAEIMKGYEGWVKKSRPDICLVVGDVNSTVACALVAAKLGIAVAHVEAGLRSFDRTMPEEINRVVTDSISDFMFVTEPSGVFNLAREGKPLSAIHLVGHVMIDTLFRMLPKAKDRMLYKDLGLKEKKYAFFTIHRPSNVDEVHVFKENLSRIVWLSKIVPVVFSVHPRTRKNLEQLDIYNDIKKCSYIKVLGPLSYVDSLSLIMNAQLVVTDSGGLQEETSALGVPCLTLRDNTERPITLTNGTNTLIAGDWELFKTSVFQIVDGKYKKTNSGIPFWDGKSGERILRILESM